MTAGRTYRARTIVVFIGAVTLAASAGCPRVIPPLERPIVRLDGVSASRTPGSGLGVRVRFHVINPNPVAMTLRVVDWELSLAGAPPVRGRAAVEAIAPAGGPVDVEFDLAIPPAIAAAALARWPDRDDGAGDASDDLGYALRGTLHLLRGTLHFLSPRGDVGAVFDDEARIPEQKTPIQARPESAN